MSALFCASCVMPILDEGQTVFICEYCETRTEVDR
jgi:hypothetical protein